LIRHRQIFGKIEENFFTKLSGKGVESGIIYPDPGSKKAPDPESGTQKKSD
jgi:hypothetical protein